MNSEVRGLLATACEWLGIGVRRPEPAPPVDPAPPVPAFWFGRCVHGVQFLNACDECPDGFPAIDHARNSPDGR